MGDLIDMQVLKYESHFKDFYNEMDLETLQDLIGYSFHNKDFRRSNDSFEKARLRALVVVTLNKLDYADVDYVKLLNKLRSVVYL